MKNKQWVWITGVTGYTGSFLVKEIRQRYPDTLILGLGRKPECKLSLDAYSSVDLVDAKAIDEQLKLYPAKLIFHLAAAMPPLSDQELWHLNVAMIYELMIALSRSKLLNTKLLSVGSAAELMNKASGAYTENDPAFGFTPYGKSKAVQAKLAKLLAKELGLDVYFARSFNFLGPGLPEKWVAGRLCKQLATSKEKLVLGNLQAERDFVDIRDVVSAYCDIVEKGEPGEVYNVCTGRATAISTLVEKACELLGDERPEIESDMEQLSRSEVSSVYGDPQKITRATGWRPKIAFTQSLQDMIEAYRDAE
ncbi:MAG: GDP-mannose 4,6-dehydratase [Gammaproteobacteria bacterium]|nr:GDP-mannose 4,6-dehydratase [Gammaproteobacteria bacterium]